MHKMESSAHVQNNWSESLQRNMFRAGNKYQKQLEFRTSWKKQAFLNDRQTVSTWQLSPSFLHIFASTG